MKTFACGMLILVAAVGAGCIGGRYAVKYADGTSASVWVASLGKEPKLADASLTVGTNAVFRLGTYESKQDKAVEFLNKALDTAKALK